MTFEEFFTKKRIDLTALQKAEPGLFSEFKSHFEQMGEKSFDHTKKYWFNKLRHLYHLAAELKPERVHIPNPLAEQTITESLSETVEAPKPKLGFVPKFKAPPNTASIAPENKLEDKPLNKEEEKPIDATEPVSQRPAYKPKFNMKNIPPKKEE